MVKILIVDDQPTFLRLIDKILTQNNYEVLKASNVVDAIQILRAEKIELLITDAIMPGPTGFDLIVTIRNDSILKNLPIIMLTAKREQKDVEKSIALGVNGYVVKPIQPEILLEKVSSLLEKTYGTAVATHAKAEFSARWQDTTTVTEVSESGLVLESNFSVPLGFPLGINSDVFKNLGTNDLLLTAHECTAIKTKPGYYKIKTLFANPTNKDLEAIQKWILSQQKQKAS